MANVLEENKDDFVVVLFFQKDSKWETSENGRGASFLGEEDLRVGKGEQHLEECGVNISEFAHVHVPKLSLHQSRSLHYQIIKFSLDAIQPVILWKQITLETGYVLYYILAVLI